ncbi:hypothetical protein SAMN05444164_5597 [Bradyrhizobium erythrophlei]|uniref:Uncharacterized protein n=1 Tax=Bradyrhizobium erythrophlei TaxID=1437360 RepID=A0A1H5D0Z9_9BRAD|nr:hypothetical protein SAMN05444164_5597 [Bradyrhizobium erythrophlei]
MEEVGQWPDSRSKPTKCQMIVRFVPQKPSEAHWMPLSCPAQRQGIVFAEVRGVFTQPGSERAIVTSDSPPTPDFHLPAQHFRKGLTDDISFPLPVDKEFRLTPDFVFRPL